MFSINAILHPTDFSPGARQALAYAIQMARRHQATLHVLHVGPHVGGDRSGGSDRASDDPDDAGAPDVHRNAADDAQPTPAEARMNELVREAGAADVTVRTAYRRSSAPGPLVIEYAEEQSVDLVVMGTHGRRGLKRMLVGSVAEEVVHEASCSVMTVREKQHTPEQPSIDRILLPVDLSEFTAPLYHAAMAIAEVHGAGVDLLHVVEPLPYPRPLVGGISVHDLVPDPSERSAELLSELAGEEARPSVAVTTHTAEGHAAETIVEQADTLDTDLIIMASQGISGVERLLLGSVTARVMRRAQCPVFIARVQPEPFPE